MPSETPDPDGQWPQGDTRLLSTPVAQELLAAATPAYLAYTRPDGFPRNIPMNFHWNGSEVVMGAFAGTFKVAALRVRPHVAVTIATHQQGAKALLLRGEVALADRDGLLEEYAIAHRRTMGNKRRGTTSPRSTSPGCGWSASRCTRSGQASWTSPAGCRSARPASSGKR
jgi:hypothetical protein